MVSSNGTRPGIHPGCALRERVLRLLKVLDERNLVSPVSDEESPVVEFPIVDGTLRIFGEHSNRRAEHLDERFCHFLVSGGIITLTLPILAISTSLHVCEMSLSNFFIGFLSGNDEVIFQPEDLDILSFFHPGFTRENSETQL